jgi:hypothetical protein
MVNWE